MPEGHGGNIMGWSRIKYIGGPDYFKISGSDRGPDRDILLGLTKTSFFSKSLTERDRQV